VNRLVTTTRLSIITSNALDAADRILAQTRKGTDGSLITLRRRGYDAASRPTSETNALNGVTTYSEALDANSQRVRTTTYPDGGTRVETYFRDGQPASRSGTASFPARYEYGSVQDNSIYRAFSKEIRLNSDGTDTSEWMTNYLDAVARSYKTLYAAAQAPFPYRQSFYNNLGQLWKERDPDGVVTLYGFNAKGDREYTCIDSNLNDIIDLSGLDRITQTTDDVLANYSTNVVRTRTFVWSTNADSTATLIATRETSVEGSRTWTTTPAGVNLNWTRYSNGHRYVTNTAPDGSYSVSDVYQGRLQSLTQKDSSGAQIGQTTYGYDPHGRQNAMTDARNGTTTVAFNNADQVASVTTPPPGTGASAQTTITYYDTMLRATNVVQPDGASVTNLFYPTGLLMKTSGGRTYPVQYTYDPQGRLQTMTTWTNFAGSSGAAVTTWNYDAPRGWLANKRYADNTGPDYTYSGAGRLSTRQWVRTVSGGARLTTTSSYNNAGELSAISYNDGTTPSVSYNNDRRARLAQVVRNGITTTLTYNDANQLQGEIYSGGVLGGLIVTNLYDSFLRRTEVASKNASTQLAATDYGYDTASRLQTVTAGVNSATYSYLANSPLVSQITFKSNTIVRMTTTKAYDFLNRLAQISSVPSASSVVSFSYAYNSANQRVRTTLADSSYWVYEYDNLGQVKTGKRYWSDNTPVAGQQFAYGFDDIGNRTSTKAGGDANGANLRTANYTGNNLNQYSQRDVPGTVDIIGAATATATNVNVNNQLAYRRGEYYQVPLSINNASAAQWPSVTNRAVQNGTTNSVTGNVFLPQTPEVFSHDADGSLTNDGRWAFTRDGENRLIAMAAPTTAPSGSCKSLTFAYDYQGRRISKVVSNWTGSAWSKLSEQRFLYDGWNLIADLDANNNLLHSYSWGLDLSGSMQRAGGVGGLIGITVQSGTNAGNYFLAYDGNGNTAALANAADGTIAARYEYGPFGEPIRTSDGGAKENPFRFSTKFSDDESDLVYYGYRFYSPIAARWQTRDPIGESGGQHLYTFVQNDALNQVDPTGQSGIPGRILIDPYRPANKDKCCLCTPPGQIDFTAGDNGSGSGQFKMQITFVKKQGCYSDLQIRWWSCWRVGGVCGVLPCNDSTTCSFASKAGNTHDIGILVRWLSCKDFRWTPDQKGGSLYCRVEPGYWGFVFGKWICD